MTVIDNMPRSCMGQPRFLRNVRFLPMVAMLLFGGQALHSVKALLLFTNHHPNRWKAVLSQRFRHDHPEPFRFCKHDHRPPHRCSSSLPMAKNGKGGGGGCGCGGKGKKKAPPPANNNNFRVLSGYFPEPSFRIMNTGEGTVEVTASADNSNLPTETDLGDCQFAQFGPRMPFSGRLEWASPPEAHLPLTNEKNGESETEDLVLVVKRGLCSFESKARAAMTVGAKAVILVNDDDETFLAISDAAAAGSPPPPEDAAATADAPPPQPSKEEELPPFVVVPSSVGPSLKDGNRVSIRPLDWERPKCWGTWDSMAATDNLDDRSLGSAATAEASYVLPLFPVSQEPLLPGATLSMRLGKRERDELEHFLQTQGDSAASTDKVIHAAVAYCLDPAKNVLAEKACLATIDLEQAQGPSLTAVGIEPCQLRSLIRDSTRAGLGLGLVVPEEPNQPKGPGEVHLKAGIEDILRARIDSDALPKDLEDWSFAVCRALDLPPRQMQAALACSTLERLRGIERVLNRRTAEISTAKKTSAVSGTNFVSAAVQKVLPSVVCVEIPATSGGIRITGGSINSKAAGFIMDSDGIIVTNRHVIVNEGGGGEASENGSSADAAIAVTVTLQDGRKYSASVLAVSESYDIAFLKIETEEALPVAPLGNGDSVALGDWMIAVGCPAEFDHLVSLGIASTIQTPKPAGKGGDSEIILDKSASFIGTDALFNKGISGGPLLNEAGDVVGMCTYLREDLNGLGFAISINRVLDAFDELLHGNEVAEAQ